MQKKLVAVFLTGALMLGGCGAAVTTIEEQEDAQAETAGEEAAKDAEVETESKDEVQEEVETEIEESEEEIPVYEEDKNVYGNTIGNILNDGIMIYNEEDGCLYFQNLYSGRFVKVVPDTGHTDNLGDELFAMYSINLYDGKLYGTEITSAGQSGRVYEYDLKSGDIEILREDTVNYLQVVNGSLYYTDMGDNTLRKMDEESREETILVNEPVYDPAVYKDIIVFQLDSDKESLYSIPKDGGEMTKLNDVRSYSPIIYQDRIYYSSMDSDEQYTIRSMNLDGSGDEIFLPESVLSKNVYDGKLYYILSDTQNKIFYIDLSDETGEAQSLELDDLVRSTLKNVYGVSNLQIDRYVLLQFSGGYMMFMTRIKTSGQMIEDEFIYNMNTGELFTVPQYCTERGSDSVKQETDANAQAASDSGQTTDAGQSTAPASAAANPESDKDAQARAVAQSIADSIPAGSDLQRVSAAAAIVAGYCDKAVYTSDDPDYRSAYGLFCKGVYTCAGSTRALGLVLECMGYSWSHVNENQWTHQWCELTMDGQKGWADGMGGVAGYGDYPYPVEP